jgi:hypothetical protein
MARCALGPSLLVDSIHASGGRGEGIGSCGHHHSQHEWETGHTVIMALAVVKEARAAQAKKVDPSQTRPRTQADSLF